MNRSRRVLSLLLLLLILTLASGAWLFRAALFGEQGDPRAAGVDTFMVAPGTVASEIAVRLAARQLVQSQDGFIWYLRLRGLEDALKSGTYLLPHSSSTAEIVDVLTTGRFARTTVTFPEGWTTEKMGARLQTALVTDSANFVDAARSEVTASQLGYSELATLDGMLFPDTYVFPLHAQPVQVVREMVAHFRWVMGEDWLGQARRDVYGLRGILTLASIIEAEITLPGEAGDVAAVYRNRLKRGMKLEADPTVQFLLPDGPRRLLLDDLRIESPYNTYLHPGLPPGPINNPGSLALRAAVTPPEAPWLFMVATGDGGHTFSRTLEEHLRAKEEFDAVRRKVSRQQQLKNR